MKTQDDITRRYSGILPELKRLGYRATLDQGGFHERCRLAVSREPTASIHMDGSWDRSDGTSGHDEHELLDFYRTQRADTARRHLHDNDWKGIALDALHLLRGIGEITVVTDCRYSEGEDRLHVRYRAGSAPEKTTSFTRPQARLETLIGRLERP